ncbi:hypothetical protein F4775DRAFT_485994 [Biscogniauxia sp. FL1348]|nr:hypothetical protein F4775DRAFT_485994 [Biscogniauxia sp. FL1348]
MTEKDIIHAYRHLYRDFLRAIHYAKPARYTMLYQLRAAFRDKEATYNEGVVNRTRAFLKSAASVRGVEHCVLKNLLLIAWWRHFEKLKSWKYIKAHQESSRPKPEFQQQVLSSAYEHYDRTIAMMNKSLGICLR